MNVPTEHGEDSPAGRRRPAWSFFVVSFVCFVLGAVSAVVHALGGPLVFAFSIVGSVFLIFGALETKK